MGWLVFRSAIHHSKYDVVAKCDAVGPASHHPAPIHTTKTKKWPMNLKRTRVGAAWESMEGEKGRANGKLYGNTKHYVKVILKKRSKEKSMLYLFSLFCSI